MAQLLVDVSEHNGDIDWQLVKDAGYHAIIRIGFGRMDDGGRYDYKWERNVAECERLEIPWGAYWYSYAISQESARLEAQALVEAMKGHNPAYPLYFDSEQPGTQAVALGNAEAFGDVVESAGYWCGVYASQSWWNDNLRGLERFTKWVAKWSDVEPNVADCDLWQNRGADAEDFALRGSVPGIGWSDVNVLMRETMLNEIGRWDVPKEETPTVHVCPTCGQPVPDEPVEQEPVEDVKPEEMPDQETDSITNLLTYNQRAAEVMYHMCTHDGNGGHGYSQYRRWGDGTSEWIALSDGTVVSIPNGDFDCSSAVITAWEAVLPGSTADATYTGNMVEEMVGTGLWEWHPMGDGYIAQAGDIYLNEVHHTAMCWTAEPDIMMQFSLSEHNTIDGQQGDQTGWESNIKPYANYGYGGWDGKLVYVGPQPWDDENAADEQEPIVVPPAPEEEDGMRIDEDGYWGRETTVALQMYFDTVVDGEIWHQWQPNVDMNPALTTGWICDASAKGSPLIRAMQLALGTEVDGVFGTNDICALQERMGTVVDGHLDEGSPCVAEMQRRLNEGYLF